MAPKAVMVTTQPLNTETPRECHSTVILFTATAYPSTAFGTQSQSVARQRGSSVIQSPPLGRSVSPQIGRAG